MTASQTLQIVNIEDSQLKNDLEIACKYVLKIFEIKVAEVPPLGAKPIVIFPAQDNIPRCCIDERIFAGIYPINLTCLKARGYNQLVYQFAHELCHIYMLPHDFNKVEQSILMPYQPDKIFPWNNWFAESMCFTMSYLCLNMMPNEWKMSPPPFLDWINYAQTFIYYRQSEIIRHSSELKISSYDQANEWVRSELPTLVKTCTETNRAVQSTCAIVLEKMLLEHQNAWGAICTLGDSIDHPTTDFSRWAELTTTKEQHKLVKALAQTFDPTQHHEAQPNSG